MSLTEAQQRVVSPWLGITRYTVIAHCVAPSRTVIVRATDGRLYYLSPTGLFSRCR